jgi:heme-degrading monooxygenase HmoA
MYARLTFIEIDPKDSKELSSIYNTEIVAAIREFKGLRDAILLESTDGSGQVISMTTWDSQADADVYESSGTYRRLVDQLKDRFISKPVLKTYNAQENKVPVM